MILKVESFAVIIHLEFLNIKAFALCMRETSVFTQQLNRQSL